MKAVYRSIKPYWLYLIFIGEKTIEVGKNFPKAEDWNKEVFLHCSKDMRSFKRIPEKDRGWMQKYLGKCACKFVCNFIDRYLYGYCTHPEIGMDYDCGDNWWEIADEDLEKACLTYEEFKMYALGYEDIYGWHISDLVIYDKPRELGEFKHECNGVCVDTKRKIKCDRITVDGFSCNGLKPITRPPQSWCYVEVQG